MEVVAHPGLTPTSQHAGTTSDNSEAMAPPISNPEIPVSTQPQPQVKLPYGPVAWQTLNGSM